MQKLLFIALTINALLTCACVAPKKFRAEQSAKNAAQEREAVLYCQLEDRKKEAETLIRQVGDLNRSVGQQETKIAELNQELGSRTQQMGESASKLLGEKNALEKELNAKKETLARRESSLGKIKNVQQQRRDSIARMAAALEKLYEAQKSAGVDIATESETLALTLPDALLFESNGISVGENGKNLLAPLAGFLSLRPELDVDIVANTDNAPPKDKSIKDSWDWSLQRATAVTRLLIREFNTNANQLTPVGRGEFYPLSSNETAEGRQRNRRTTVVFRPALPAVPAAD